MSFLESLEGWFDTKIFLAKSGVKDTFVALDNSGMFVRLS